MWYREMERSLQIFGEHVFSYGPFYGIMRPIAKAGNHPSLSNPLLIVLLIVRLVDVEQVKRIIRELAEKYSSNLQQKINGRIEAMNRDDKSHYLIYRVLGISDEQGDQIDIYQNKGRFLYKYAGSFLEEATLMCFEYRYPSAKKKVKINNVLGTRPKQFEIDCLVGNDAIEIKWRDATTDGDHITKEHTRVKVIQSCGFRPVRLMFYYPNRDQAKRIQSTLETLYSGVSGKYYAGEMAWDYIKEATSIDFKQILTEIASERG